MKPVINAKRFELTDDVKERIYKKLNKLNKFFNPETEATVTLREERGKVKVEITIYRGSTIFRAEEADREVISAIDRAVDIIERQIRKNRTRLEKKLHEGTDQIQFESYESENDDEIIISKVKKFSFEPMTVEEAVMQMNLLSHRFYMFLNAETGTFNLVYKRDEDNYGLIEPKD